MRYIILIVVTIIGCGVPPVEEDAKLIKIAEGLKFAEGPAWSNRGVLYVSNCYGDWIMQVKNSSVDTFVTTPTSPDSFENTNGLTIGRDGSLYACDFGKGAILRFSPTKECVVYASGFDGKRFNRPNDLAFNIKGNLYFTDPNKYDKEDRDGCIYRVDNKTKEVTKVHDGLAFPNGIAFSADGQYLYVCESAMNRIIKFPVNDDGSLDDYTVFINLPGDDPDGIAFDMQGNLYAAHFGTGKVHIINPAGEVVSEIETPGTKTTNVEFGGLDMKTLFITEAETNAVYKIRVEIPGLRLFYSDFSD